MSFLFESRHAFKNYLNIPQMNALIGTGFV